MIMDDNCSTLMVLYLILREVYGITVADLKCLRKKFSNIIKIYIYIYMCK